MTTEIVFLLACVCSACALRAPPPPNEIDCDVDRAAERYPTHCADAAVLAPTPDLDASTSQ